MTLFETSLFLKIIFDTQQRHIFASLKSHLKNETRCGYFVIYYSTNINAY